MYPPILETERLILKAYQSEDEEAFVEMTSDEYHTEKVGDEKTRRDLFHKCFKIYASKDDRWFWIWGVFKNDQLCGHLELKDTEHTNENELEVVYSVHINERRKGVMFEVLCLFQKMQKEWDRKIIATVDFDNLKSIQLLEKIGIENKEIYTDEDGDQYFKFTLK